MSSPEHASIVQELKSGRCVAYFTLGCSMRPLLTERRTHVMIAPVEQAKNGDILLYQRKSGSLVLHRCIRQDLQHYYMRGDNTYGLEPIAKEQAIGVVTHIYRNGKQFAVSRSLGYKGYAVLWRILYPLRWLLWTAKRILRRICK